MNTFSLKEEVNLPVVYGVSSESEEERNKLAIAAINVPVVSSPAEQSLAASCVRDIRQYVAAVHEARMSISRRLDHAKERLIALERDHCCPLIEQEERLKDRMTEFNTLEKQRVSTEEEIRRRTIEVQQRKLECALESTKLLQEAATDEASLKAAIQQEIGCHEALAALHGQIMAPLPSVSRAKGAFTKPDLQWTCHDVHALYAARPDLCRVEPNASAIRASCVPEMPIPGLRCWWVDRTTVRR